MNKVKIGKIVGTHALKGELKIRSNSDFSEERFQVGKTIDISYQNEKITFEICSKRMHKGNYLLAFAGYQDINLVEKYIGCLVYADKEEALLAKGEYFIEDVVGCKVYTEEDKYVGDVEEITNNGRHDILVIKGPFDKVSIPYVDAFVIEEDIKGKKIIVRLIPGMLNEN